MNSWEKSDSCFIGYGDAFDINGNAAISDYCMSQHENGGSCFNCPRDNTEACPIRFEDFCDWIKTLPYSEHWPQRWLLLQQNESEREK